MSEILAVKTISAEEVIATIVENNDDHYIIEKARVLVMQQDNKGNVNLGMLPFMVSSNDPELTTEANIRLNKKDIISEVIGVPQALQTAYLQQVSGIVL